MPIAASVFLHPYPDAAHLSVVRADVTLRYKMEVKTNAALPRGWRRAPVAGEPAAPEGRQRVLRGHGGRFDRGFTTKEITILTPRPSGMRR